MDDHTPNTDIAWNVPRLRHDRGRIQAELAARLTERDDKRWTFSMVSAAEPHDAPTGIGNSPSTR